MSIIYYMWLAHAKGTSDAKCRILSLPLNLMPPRLYISWYTRNRAIKKIYY